MSSQAEEERFGSTTPFGEPYWYNPENASPYYNEHHKAFRAKMRKFVDDEIIPHVDEWESAERIPDRIYERAAEVGLLQATVGHPEPLAGPRPEGFDPFFAMIAYDELSRCASGGVCWGLTGGLGIGLPPVVYYGSDAMKENVAKPCLAGKKKIALAVSEATAGSDVANLKTTAVEDGNGNYVVNGLKKWITCGLVADFFTTAVRTGSKEDGMGGISLLLIEKNRKGVSVRPMDCMGAKGSATAYVEFDDVVVPMENLIGDVTCLLRNFITERMGIAVQANRFARMALQLTCEYAKRRRAFGKKLEDQPVVRQKSLTWHVQLYLPTTSSNRSYTAWRRWKSTGTPTIGSTVFSSSAPRLPFSKCRQRAPSKCAPARPRTPTAVMRTLRAIEWSLSTDMSYLLQYPADLRTSCSTPQRGSHSRDASDL